MTPTDAAYVAGLFDGEGTFGVYKVNTRGYYHYRPTAKFVTTNMLLAQSVSETTGLPMSKHRAQNARCRESFSVGAVAGVRLGLFIPQLIPYLRLKKEAARIVLRYLSLDRESGVRIPESTREQMEELYQLTRIVNMRGIVERD